MRKIMQTASLLALTHLASAAVPIPGWYSTLFGGYAFLPNNINASMPNGHYINQVGYGPGFDAGGSFGFKSNPMRYEAEFTYLNAKLKHFRIDNVDQAQNHGSTAGYFGMANVFYDFPTIIEPLEPFVGIGIGYGYLQARLNHSGPNFDLAFRRSDSTFAYQPAAGVTFNFSEFYALYADYRYIGTSNVNQFGERFQAHLFNAGIVFRLDGKIYK